jgi:hypothetical protein
MAEAIQTGTSIWGFPVHQANVLFIELDTPWMLVHERWLEAEPRFEPSFVQAYEPCSIDYREFLRPYQDERHKAIMDMLWDLHKRYQFGVVFVDALREVAPGDLSMSGTPRRVYDAFKTLFPNCSIVFIHHERKSGSNTFGPGDPLQAAAGSMEFVNVAQVALQFHQRGKDTWLSHRKTQASAEFDPLPISLGSDGVYVRHRDQQRFAVVEKVMAENPGLGMRELDKLIGEKLGMTDRSARVIRTAMMNGRKESGDAN